MANFKRAITITMIFFVIPPFIFAASNVVVNPDTINANEGAWLMVTADIATSETIELFIIADFNGDGAKNGDDFIMRYHRIQDGVLPMLGGSPKPGDEDGENGKLLTYIDLWNKPQVAGDYIVIVKDSQGEASDTAEILQQSLGQSVSGTLTNQNDIAIAGIISSQDENGVERMTMTNEAGAYTLNLPTGKTAVAGLGLGKITDFDAGSVQLIEMSSGTNLTNVNLKVYNGDYTVSGRVMNTTEAVPVPYVMIWAEVDEDSGNDMQSIAFTDSDGYYTLPVRNGSWEVGLGEMECNQRGLSGRNFYDTMVTDSNVLNLDFNMQSANTYISGLVTQKSDGTPLIGYEICVEKQGEEEICTNTRGSDGSYVVLVREGTWEVEIEEDDVQRGGFIPPASKSVSPTIAKPSSGTNFQLEKPTSFIEAEVKEVGLGTPVEDVGVWISDENWNFLSSLDTNSEGKALFGVLPGAYHVGLSFEDIFELGFLAAENQEATVVTSETKKLLFELEKGTGTIEGTLTLDSSPVEDVNVTIWKYDGGDYTWGGFRQSAADGTYSIPIKPGTYYVQPDPNHLMEKDIAPVEAQEINATAGANVLNFNLSSYDATIEVHVSGGGFPLDHIGTFIKATEFAPFMLGNQSTNSSGIATYKVAAGTYYIEPNHQDVTNAGFLPGNRRQITVSTGQTQEVFFQLRPLGSRTVLEGLLGVFSIDETERQYMDENQDGSLDISDAISLIIEGK